MPAPRQAAPSVARRRPRHPSRHQSLHPRRRRRPGSARRAAARRADRALPAPRAPPVRRPLRLPLRRAPPVRPVCRSARRACWLAPRAAPSVAHAARRRSPNRVLLPAWPPQPTPAHSTSSSVRLAPVRVVVPSPPSEAAAPPKERRDVRRVELGPSDAGLGFGRFTRVESRGRSFIVLTEAVPQPKFTVTTIITEKGVPLRKIESALAHPLAREEDRDTVRHQLDLQHDDTLRRLDDLVLENAPRRVVWSDQSRSVEAGVLAWAMSAVAQLAETEAGTDETARQLRLTRETALVEEDALRAFQVTAFARVVVDPQHTGRVPRRAVRAVSGWCRAFATAALQAEGGRDRRARAPGDPALLARARAHGLLRPARAPGEGVSRRSTSPTSRSPPVDPQVPVFEMLPAFEEDGAAAFEPRPVPRTLLDEHSAQGEQCRVLATRLVALGRDKRLRRIGVVGTAAGEGTTTVALGLARALSKDREAPRPAPGARPGPTDPRRRARPRPSRDRGAPVPGRPVRGPRPAPRATVGLLASLGGTRGRPGRARPVPSRAS